LYDEPPKIKVIYFFVNRLASIIFAAMLAGSPQAVRRRLSAVRVRCGLSALAKPLRKQT
jgi:uncharacterized membrane protein